MPKTRIGLEELSDMINRRTGDRTSVHIDGRTIIIGYDNSPLATVKIVFIWPLGKSGEELKPGRPTIIIHTQKNGTKEFFTVSPSGARVCVGKLIEIFPEIDKNSESG